jgi:NAD(P)-dependent dehydrogenase (short-subunit alcohol dehydrogenase family)
MAALAGRVALVTGGGRGIGRATALALAERGADVAVMSRSMPELEETAALVRAIGRRKAWPWWAMSPMAPRSTRR